MNDQFALSIEHRHGRNVSVHPAEEEARAQLLEYVQQWWEAEIHDVDLPENPEEAIEDYFERVPDEFYTIDPCSVKSPISVETPEEA